MHCYKNPSDVDWLRDLAEQGYGELEDYYPETAAGEIVPSDPYYGRNIIWDGFEGRMIRVYPRHVRAIFGNIFDEDKLAAIVSGVDQAEERLVFTAPYGDVGVIGLTDVQESLEDEDEEDSYTTGDEELDRYLAEGDEYFEDEHGLDLDDIKEYVKDPKAYLEFYSDDEEERAEHAKELDDGIELIREMNERLQDAVDNDEGDLGDFWIQIRDGNHRAFGAFASGEPYIYMIVMDNTIRDLDPKNPEHARVIEALE